MLMYRCIKSNRGQAMVELALVLPILLLIVIGMMDFGMVISQYMVMAEASREAARSAALGGSNATVTAVATVAASQFDTDQLIVDIVPPTTRVRGSGVTVTVSTPVTVTELLRPFFPDGLIVRGTTTMRVE